MYIIENICDSMSPILLPAIFEYFMRLIVSEGRQITLSFSVLTYCNNDDFDGLKKLNLQLKKCLY